MTVLRYTRNGLEYTANANELPAEAIAYLLQYGWAQSLQDSIAGREKRVREELEAKVATGVVHADLIDIAAEVAMDLEGQLNKRADAIIAGTIGTRSVGEPRDPLKPVAADMIRNKIVKHNEKLRKLGKPEVKVSKERRAELVAELLANNRDVVKAEYDRRMAEDTGELDVDI